MKKYIFLFVAILAVMLYFANSGAVKQHKTLTLAHALPVEHPVHKAMVQMAELCEKKSGGKLKIEIFPGSQLGSERECLELLQIGSIDITKVSAAVCENFIPEMKALGFPFIFRDKEHIDKVLYGPIGREMLLKGEKFWLRGLCFYDAGTRCFYTKDRPIETPDDLKGMKIRVMNSNTFIQMVKGLGGSPTPISWGELYTALQQGVVDGAENNLPSFYLSHHYEVCKYYSFDEHAAVPDVLLISNKTWEKLSGEEQKWLQEAADESAILQKKLWAESEQESLEEIQKAGVKVNYPDKEPFIEMLKPFYESYKDDPVLWPYIEKIRAVE